MSGFNEQLAQEFTHWRQAVLHRHVLLGAILAIGGVPHQGHGAIDVFVRECNPRRHRGLLNSNLFGPVRIARRGEVSA